MKRWSLYDLDWHASYWLSRSDNRNHICRRLLSLLMGHILLVAERYKGVVNSNMRKVFTFLLRILFLMLALPKFT